MPSAAAPGSLTPHVRADGHGSECSNQNEAGQARRGPAALFTWVLLTDLGDQEGAHSGAGAAAQRVAHLEACNGGGDMP